MARAATQQRVDSELNEDKLTSFRTKAKDALSPGQVPGDADVLGGPYRNKTLRASQPRGNRTVWEGAAPGGEAAGPQQSSLRKALGLGSLW